MKTLLICVLVVLLLALGSNAVEPVQLSGASGQTILAQIAGPSQTTNTTAMPGLWTWGKTPMGYALNSSGQLIPVQQLLDNDYGGWVPSI